MTSFSTNFPTVENPVSVGGALITATTSGVSWAGNEAAVRVVSAGLAENLNYNDATRSDALAVCTGTWKPDQSASLTVGSFAATGGNNAQEFEIHLRVDPVTGAGYEITWGYSNPYYLITRWTAGGGFVFILNQQNTSYQPVPGDVLTASIVGSTITMYTKGSQVVQVTDSVLTTGNPGFGFNTGAPGVAEYGISSFSATDGTMGLRLLGSSRLVQI